jgi:hypothetical protein
MNPIGPGLKAAAISLMIILGLSGTVGGLGLYEKQVYEARLAQLTLGWPSIDFYFFYKIFMSWMASGVVGPDDVAVPQSLRSRLAPFYDRDLSVVRIAYSSRIDRLGLTDCTKIYFGDRTIVDAIRLERPLSAGQARWLAHEMTHAEQCLRWGGRKNYADTWFRQLAKEVLAAILQGKLSTVIQSVSRAQSSVIHDNMSMEQEADERADRVVEHWK